MISRRAEPSNKRKVQGDSLGVLNHPGKSTDLAAVRRALWDAADELRANSKLTAAQYRHAVLGPIFLAYAEYRFEEVRPELEAKATARNPVTPQDYKAETASTSSRAGAASGWPT